MGSSGPEQPAPRPRPWSLRWRRWLAWWRAEWRAWFQPARPPPPSLVDREREADHLIQQMGRRLGFDRTVDGSVITLRGVRGPFRATVRVRKRRAPGEQLRFEQHIRVESEQPLVESTVRIEPRVGAGGALRAHEPVFDRVAMVQGPVPVARAVLSARLRAAVLGQGGVWTLEPRALAWTAWRAPTDLATITEQVLSLAGQRAEEGPHPIQGLQRRVCEDPVAGVRSAALQILLERFGDDPAARAAAEAAVTDGNASLRFAAARALGAEGLETLVALVRDPATPPGIRWAAAGRIDDVNRLRHAAWHLIGARPLEVRLEGLQLLGRVGGPADLADLEALTRKRPSTLRAAAARARDRVRLRHAELGAGQLGIVEAESEAGRLSDASAEPGDEDERRLRSGADR